MRRAGGAAAALSLLWPGALAAPAQPRASKANFIILFVDGKPPRLAMGGVGVGALWAAGGRAQTR